MFFFWNISKKQHLSAQTVAVASRGIFTQNLLLVVFIMLQKLRLQCIIHFTVFLVKANPLLFFAVNTTTSR